MKKSELKKLIKHIITEAKPANKKAVTEDITGLVATFLSQDITKNFSKFVKSGQAESSYVVIDTSEPVNARRMKANTIEFWIEPKDLTKRSINVELIINVGVRD